METETEGKGIIRVPAHFKEAIDLYVKEGIMPGDFGYAVLTNNLIGCFMYADSINLAHLGEIVSYMWWEVPYCCWGSDEKVRKWVEGHQQRREHRVNG